MHSRTTSCSRCPRSRPRPPPLRSCVRPRGPSCSPRSRSAGSAGPGRRACSGSPRAARRRAPPAGRSARSSRSRPPSGAPDPQAGIARQRIMLTAALGIGAVLWVRLAQPIGMRSGALLVAFAASAPFVRDILTGHFEGVLLIGLALLAIGLRDRRTVMIAAGVVLLALKPHLFIALAVIILVWLIRERWYRALAGTAAVLGLLAAIGSASDPLAGPALVTRSFAKQNVASATAWGFASRIGDASGLFAAAFIVLIPIAPYAQSYAAFLLLPAVAIALTGLRPLTAIIAASTIVIVTWVAYALELAGDPRSFVGVLPAIALGVITLRAWARRTPSPEPAAARS